MIDIIDPDEDSAPPIFKGAELCIQQVHSRNKIPILTGGTGFYINSVCYNYTFADAKKDDELRRHLRIQANEYGNEYLYKKLEKRSKSS